MSEQTSGRTGPIPYPTSYPPLAHRQEGQGIQLQYPGPPAPRGKGLPQSSDRLVLTYALPLRRSLFSDKIPGLQLCEVQGWFWVNSWYLLFGDHDFYNGLPNSRGKVQELSTCKRIDSFITNHAEVEGELFTLVFFKKKYSRKQRSLTALNALTHRNHMKCTPRLCEPTESINVLLFLSFLSISGVCEIFHEISRNSQSVQV